MAAVIWACAVVLLLGLLALSSWIIDLEDAEIQREEAERPAHLEPEQWR